MCLYSFLIFDVRIEHDGHTLNALDCTKLFLMWMRTGTSQRQLAHLFNVSQPHVSGIIQKCLQAAVEKFVPFHLGFGKQHGLTEEKILADLSTWMSRQVAEKFWNTDILGVADGTYIYCMSAGGMQGQKLLYSSHKYRLLSKVTNGVILKIINLSAPEMSFESLENNQHTE